MKKIISWIMLVAMILGMFAGCGKAADPTQPATTAPSEIPEVTVVTENNALDVINYLQFIYKDSGAKTSGNFDRFGIVRIAGVPYTVEWTVDVGEDKVKIIVNDDGTVTIDVNEKCTEDTVYTLTATITDANGNTETASWEYLLPGVASLEEMHAIIDQAYSLEVGEALTEEVTLTGVISTIDTPYSDQYKNITVTIIIEGREDKPIMCYRLKGEGAAELNPGDTISVQGIIKNYNNKIEFDAGCQLTTVEKTGKAVEIPSDPHEILNDVYALGENESLPYGPVTMTGRICSIDTPWSDQYKNITVSIIIDWYTIKCYRLKGEGAENLEMNDIITVKGYIKKYNGTREFDVPELLDVVKVGEYAQPADQLHVAKVAYNLDPGWTVPYGDVTLTGTITKGGTWSEQYKNITVTMVVDGDDKGEYPIECYRMTIPEDASKELKAAIKTLDVGDKITVKGILMKYQNAKSGATKVEFNVPELVKVVKAPKVESGLTATLTTTLKTGDKVVIVAPTQKIAMSSVIVNSYYPKGVAVTIDGDKISGFNATEVMTVTVNSNGSYTFSYGGKNLGMASSYSSMYFGNPNDDWTLAQVSSGVYNVKNTVRGNYMQFATKYSTWQTSSSVPTDKSGNLSFYKLEGDLPGDEGGEGGTTENVYMTSAPKNGDKVVIVAANYNKALSTTKVSTYYNAGVDVAASNGKLTGYADSEVWTVIVNDDGSYSFENGGSKIAMAASNSSMSQGAVNDKWNVNSLGDGLFNIVNIGRSGMAMEWYSSKGNFSTYYKNITTDDQFFMAFYLVKAGSGSATPDTPADDATEGTIAEALAAAEGAKYKVKGVVTFKEVTSSSTNLYIQDSSGAICVRVSGTADANLGDTIIATGSKTVYSGLPQLGDATYEKSSGLTLSAEKTILDDLYEGFLCKYITIPNLKVTAIDSTNVTLLDDVDVEIKLYKGTYPAELKVGDTITFTGALGIYGTTFQLRNTLASEIVITSAGGSEGGGTDEPVTPPAEPQLLAKFTFPTSSSTSSWQDGNDMSNNTSFTSGSYKLTFTGCTKVYQKGNDASGVGFIKFGTSKLTGTLTFTVPEDVDYVMVYLAGYKSNTAKFTFNGGSTNSLAGKGTTCTFTGYKIDTSSNKTVTISTASGGLRMVMSSVEYYG